MVFESAGAEAAPGIVRGTEPHTEAPGQGSLSCPCFCILEAETTVLGYGAADGPKCMRCRGEFRDAEFEEAQVEAHPTVAMRGGAREAELVSQHQPSI